jgi:uncharacterized protein
MSEINSEILKLVTDYINEVNKKYKVEKVVLFGSYAKGTQQADSDIDLAIFIKDLDDKKRIDVMGNIISLSGKYKKDIQPIIFSGKDFYNTDNYFINNHIKKDGIEIYKKAA